MKQYHLVLDDVQWTLNKKIQTFFISDINVIYIYYIYTKYYILMI